MAQDLLNAFDISSDIDIFSAIAAITDDDVTNGDFPSPSMFLPSPATMMGMDLKAEIEAEAETDGSSSDSDEAHVVPDIDADTAFTPEALMRTDASVEDLAKMFAADAQAMAHARSLLKPAVVLKENAALKKKRAPKVPVQNKDAKYWAKRIRNTAYAKRNRDLKKKRRLLLKEQEKARTALANKGVIVQ